MTEVIGVRFKKVGKVYYFDPNGIQVKVDQPVIVETARGQEYGEVSMPNSQVEDNKIVQPLKKMVRIATEADRKTMEQNLQFEKDAFRVCEEKIQKHKLEMKLVSVEYTFDRSKILFYFSADGRVDFRELVKDLAGVFRTRIELRQIGVRDEAKMIGGLGICGRPLCCSAFLESFQPVSINMAKDQGLSLNPTKISGTCGRLMCCLKYENDAYQDLLKQTPPNESLVDTPQGRGTVLDSSLLRGTCRVRMLNSSDAPVTVPCDQCTVLRRGRDKGEVLDLPAPPEPKAAPAPRMTLEEADNARSEAAEKPRRERDRRKNDGHENRENRDNRENRENRENRDNRENRENRGNRQGNPKNKPAQQGEKPRNHGEHPKNHGEKPRNQQEKPKKDKPQQEHKPAEQGAPAKEGGEHKRRNHRGGRRNHRGGGNKPQAPKAE